MTPTKKDLIEEIESRLQETLQVFAVVNALCDRSVQRQAVADYLNANWFWRTSYMALQTTLITGLYALVDKRTDVASLLVMAKTLAGPEPAHSELVTDLEAIHTRYGCFRHKLFGHTDKRRTDIAGQFDAAGFTLDSIGADLRTLEYALRVVASIAGGAPPPERDEAGKQLRMYQFAVAQVHADTNSVLDFLESAAVTMDDSHTRGHLTIRSTKTTKTNDEG